MKICKSKVKCLGPFPGLWFLQNIPVTVVSWGLIGVGVACSYPASLLNLLQCAREADLQESEETTVRRYYCFNPFWLGDPPTLFKNNSKSLV